MLPDTKTITLSVQVVPEERERVRDIARAIPGVSVHRTHKALLAYALDVVSQNPSLLHDYLTRY